MEIWLHVMYWCIYITYFMSLEYIEVRYMYLIFQNIFLIHILFFDLLCLAPKTHLTHSLHNSYVFNLSGIHLCTPCTSPAYFWQSFFPNSNHSFSATITYKCTHYVLFTSNFSPSWSIHVYKLITVIIIILICHFHKLSAQILL